MENSDKGVISAIEALANPDCVDLWPLAMLRTFLFKGNFLRRQVKFGIFSWCFI